MGVWMDEAWMPGIYFERLLTHNESRSVMFYVDNMDIKIAFGGWDHVLLVEAAPLSVSLTAARRAHCNSYRGSSTVHLRSCSRSHSAHGMGFPAVSQAACCCAIHAIFFSSSQVCFCCAAAASLGSGMGAALGSLFISISRISS